MRPVFPQAALRGHAFYGETRAVASLNSSDTHSPPCVRSHLRDEPTAESCLVTSGQVRPVSFLAFRAGQQHVHW